MKKIGKYIMLLVIASVLKQSVCLAQNLVPNPSFEDTVACPRGLGNIQNAVGWSGYRITPDYFNSCNNTCTGGCNPGDAGIPSNKCGWQYARTGNAYAGFVSWNSLDGANIREWLGSNLTNSLVIGKRYFVNFFVSMAFSKRPGFSIIVTATNKIGARFSTFPYSPVGNNMPLDGYAQVYTDSVISDTANWVSISGSFIADSAYQYIIIGNFFDDSVTTHISLDTVAGSFPTAYYYIDDVSVTLDTTNGIADIPPYSDIRIFPNPVHDWLLIEGSGIKSYSIFDALGRKCIENASVITTLNKINVSHLSRDVYFVRINTSGNSLIKKIILTH